MTTQSELSVTLSPELYRHLRSEARKLGVPLRWLVASLVVDTMEETVDDAAAAPALA